MSSIIKVENLGKSYTISHEERERYTALRDVIARKAKKIFYFNKSTNKQIHGSTKEEFWALKDINFEVQQGDRIGIIGRNGAGKSTLLKILSRITEPTTGSVKIKGRVASLLEVGTGFHPELTGAENIYLNGAILGMSRAEVKKKFDEIVDFAEVEKFLDTPVKRYSSGMYVRLAFAVAAHLEPEILVIDEVLAVGDAEFQKKCLGKMEDVSKNEGRTVLFVSHNMNAVASLCQYAILLDKGKISYLGNVKDTIDKYYNLFNENGGGIVRQKSKDFSFDKLIFIKDTSCYKINEDITFEMCFKIDRNREKLKIGIDLGIFNEEEIMVLHFRNKWLGKFFEVNTNSNIEFKINILKPFLSPGKYFLTIFIYDDKEVLFWADKCSSFIINADNIYLNDGSIIEGYRSITIPQIEIEQILQSN